MFALGVFRLNLIIRSGEIEKVKGPSGVVMMVVEGEQENIG